MADLILQDLGGIGHGVVRLHAAIGVHFEHHAIVVGTLTDAGVGDGEIDLLDRRKNRVDKNRIHRRAFFLVALRRHIAAAELDQQFHFQLGVARQA